MKLGILMQEPENEFNFDYLSCFKTSTRKIYSLYIKSLKMRRGSLRSQKIFRFFLR